jgi:putative ABC transport system substrate-binding protein
MIPLGLDQMAIGIGRRQFMSALGGTALAWPLSAHAQQTVMPVIGLLHPGSSSEFVDFVAAFRKGLSQTGFVEGQNLAIEYRWADNHYERLPALAAELVRHQVTVIAAIGGAAPAKAAKAATTTIPIIFIAAGYPVKDDLVSSLNRPGGNLTGLSLLNLAVAGKRLELLHELIPKATLVDVLVNPTNPQTAPELEQLDVAARSLRLQTRVHNVSNTDELLTAYAALVQDKAAALLVVSDPLFTSQRNEMVALAARHAIPTVYQYREFATAGGLMSYGTNLVDAYRQSGVYTGKVLKGIKPADLPVEQVTKFEMIVNLKAARALGLEVPTSILLSADEVIE